MDPRRQDPHTLGVGISPARTYTLVMLKTLALLVFPTARSTVINGGWGVELFAVGQGPLGQASVR